MERAEVEAGLAAYVKHQTGAREVTIENAVRLSGGASRETWSLDIRIDDAVPIEAIMRADQARGAPTSAGRLLEHTLI